MRYYRATARNHICCWTFLLILEHTVKGFVEGSPISKDKRVEAFYYFLEYGYIAKNENELMSDDVITKAVKDFQVSENLFEILNFWY